jgi:hypothetical protein
MPLTIDSALTHSFWMSAPSSLLLIDRWNPNDPKRNKINTAALDFKHVDICCRGASDCLCVRNSCCLSLTSGSRGCGCTGDAERGECCKIACVCCDCGLIWPTKFCAAAHQTLCYYQVSSIPCSEEYVQECVCAVCFIQCCPNCGICAA